MTQKLVSIIVPVFNEAENIPGFYNELVNVIAKLKAKYNFETIFVDDGSIDNTHTLLTGLAEHHTSIKYIQFSRNFGKEIALSAGMRYASGAAVISLDADFQHPSKFISEFLKKWEGGAEIVIGIRKHYNHNNIFRKLGSYLFYQIQNVISETKINSNETDYRLLDRIVVDEFIKFTEHNRITRGLIDWLGFNRAYVVFPVNQRRNAKSVYSTLKLFKLAISSFVSLSLYPLKYAGYLGLIITLLSGFLGIVICIEKYFLHDRWGWNITGSASLAVLIIFMVGINLCSLGLMALYIASIHNEVINRPLYVVRQIKNL